MNICNTEKPKKSITTYNFDLFEGETDYTVCLTGTNTYDISEYKSQTKIEFEPKEMYFSLPQNEYRGLKRKEVLDMLTSQLKEFFTTETFRKSFLHEANFIKNWEGEVWPLKKK